MRRIIALTLTLVLALSLAACGGNTDQPSGSIPGSNSQATPESEPSDSPPSAMVGSESGGTVSGGSTEPAASGDSGGSADTYFNMFDSGTYHMKAKMSGNDGTESTMETYCKDGMVATVIEMDGESNRMIFRDEKMYIIMDSEKAYMEIPTQDSQSEGVVNTAGKTSTGSGTAEFNGKNLRYRNTRTTTETRRSFSSMGMICPGYETRATIM